MNVGRDLGNQPSLKQLVYETLQQKIIEGELAPGTKLTEEELAQAMNISRAPIREAINMLERDGFVRIITRKGAVVTDLTAKDIMDIWNCRIAMEPAAAALAIPNIPKKKIEEALSRVETLEKGGFPIEMYRESELEVHALFFDYLDNELMKSILTNLKAHSARARYEIDEKRGTPENKEQTLREHKKMLEAFLTGSETAAYDAVREHLSNCANRLLSLI